MSRLNWVECQLSGDELPVEDDQPTGGSAFDSLQPMEFKLPPPRDMSEGIRMELVTASVARIWTGADELPVDSLQAGGTSASEVWMLLLVRMITRVAHPATEEGPDDSEDNKELVINDFYARQDLLRQKLCDYIMGDFPSRFVLWLFSFEYLI